MIAVARLTSLNGIGRAGAVAWIAGTLWSMRREALGTRTSSTSTTA